MDEHKKVQDIAKDNYNNSSPWPQNDAWHSYTHQTIHNYVQHTLDSLNLSCEKIILNAGCGLTTYITSATIIYMDIVEKYVERFENHLVASIEKIPISNYSVDVIICVGSVLNYADIQKAFSEFKRVLNPKGFLIIEYERSNSAEFLFRKHYGDTVFLKKYHYNGQNHSLWMYNEKLVMLLSKYYGFSLIKKYRFHIISSILYRMGLPEEKAAYYSHLDTFTQLISYPFAHNEIAIYRNCSIIN